MMRVNDGLIRGMPAAKLGIDISSTSWMSFEEAGIDELSEAMEEAVDTFNDAAGMDNPAAMANPKLSVEGGEIQFAEYTVTQPPKARIRRPTAFPAEAHGIEAEAASGAHPFLLAEPNSSTDDVLQQTSNTVASETVPPKKMTSQTSRVHFDEQTIQSSPNPKSFSRRSTGLPKFALPKVDNNDNDDHATASQVQFDSTAEDHQTSFKRQATGKPTFAPDFDEGDDDGSGGEEGRTSKVHFDPLAQSTHTTFKRQPTGKVGPASAQKNTSSTCLLL
jgi:hypothetical protein